MGLFDTFKKTKVGIKEAGIGLVSRGNFWSAKDVDDQPQDISLQQKYNNAYNNFPIVSSAIDMTAEQAVQDYYFEGPHSKDLSKWAETVNLPQKFVIIAKHMLRNGNLWSEQPNKKEMKLIDPRTMTTWRKTNGEVIGHSQSIDNQYKVLWGTTGDVSKDIGFKKRVRKLNTIAHFKFNALAGDKYGNSIIHPALPLLEVKGQIEGDLKIIVRRYAAPIIHVQVGDDMHLPSDNDLTTIQSKTKNIYADTEYVTNYLTKMTALGFEGKALNMEYILKHIDSNIMKAMMTFEGPPGAEKGDKGGDEVNLRKLGRHVKALQRAIKTEFEDNIIVGQGLGNQNDHIVFGFAEEREHEIEMDILRGLVTDGIITPQKANSLLPPEFREQLPEPQENPMIQQAKTSQDQNQKPFQKGGDAIKDKPTDPTLKQKEPNQRRNKTDREIPIK